ncbi:hypothetical protein DVH24_038717 [Malus domestica]|uniref:very-long-chain (3R)-3-hydroxyacyl-CoA dehydratase n=1 Tax=Malus domestica TaxID=3750 RepID=A0A498KG38_MALDO|nr:hypothetical protein DVH24_038717 [Malus domestica]
MVGDYHAAWLMYQALPFIKKKSLSPDFPAGLSFSYYNFLRVLLVCYPFLCLKLYLHMFKQRRSKLGKHPKKKKRKTKPYAISSHLPSFPPPNASNPIPPQVPTTHSCLPPTMTLPPPPPPTSPPSRSHASNSKSCSPKPDATSPSAPTESPIPSPNRCHRSFRNPTPRPSKFVESELCGGVPIYPPTHLIFNALNSNSFDRVKAVILGQDPYHGPGQAMGLSFSVPEGVKVPSSLVNIIKEPNKDLGCSIPSHGGGVGKRREGVRKGEARLPDFFF